MRVRTRIITAVGTGTAITVLAAGPAMASTHTVQAGETLSGIAAQSGQSLARVEADNPQITNPNVITVGELVHVWGGNASLAPLRAQSGGSTKSSTSQGSTRDARQHGAGQRLAGQFRVGQRLAVEQHPGQHQQRHRLRAVVVPAVRGLARVVEHADRPGWPVRHPAQHLAEPGLLGHGRAGVGRAAGPGVPAPVRPGRHLAVGPVRRLLGHAATSSAQKGSRPRPEFLRPGPLCAANSIAPRPEFLRPGPLLCCKQHCAPAGVPPAGASLVLQTALRPGRRFSGRGVSCAPGASWLRPSYCSRPPGVSRPRL